MKTFIEAMMKKGFTYPQALRLARVVNRCRQANIYYSIEITDSYAVVYTEWGKNAIVPKLFPSLREVSA